MGNHFVEIFDQWANSYDQTVTGHDLEYRDLFLHLNHNGFDVEFEQCNDFVWIMEGIKR